MAQVQITWQRTCEYVATIDTADLRDLVSQLPGSSERDDTLSALDRIDAGNPWQYDDRALAYVINNTETGREYLGGMADDNPGLLGGTGAPEVTDLRPV